MEYDRRTEYDEYELDETLRCLKFQTKANNLILEKEDFGKDLFKCKYDSELANSVPFPSDLTLARICQASYISTISFHNNDGWELLTTAYNEKTEYKGMALWNPKLCHIIVVHAHSRRLNKNNTTSSAVSFVHYLVREIREQNKKDGPKFRLSITGHLIGAWLAQVTTFTAKFLEVMDGKFISKQDDLLDIHPHTVVFNGSRYPDALYYLCQNYQADYISLNSLDMTGYFTRLSYQYSREKDYKKHGKIKSDDLPDVAEVWDINMLLKNFGSFRWVKSSYMSTYFKHSKSYSTEKTACKLNVFSQHELNFLHFLKKYGSKIQETYLLPEFSIENDIINSPKLNQVIATVKNMFSNEPQIVDTLRQKYAEKILRDEHQLLKNELEIFNGYHFSDMYCLKLFFNSCSDFELLHIHITHSEYFDHVFELKVLNSVFEFYEKDYPTYLSEDKYVFVKWTDVYKLFSVSQNLDLENLKLIVISNLENVEVNLLQKFLEAMQTKVVILSRGSMSCEDGEFLVPANKKTIKHTVSIIERSLQSLEKDSAEKFINWSYFKVNNDCLSFNDISLANWHLPPTMFKSLLENVMIDLNCSFENLLENVLFKTLHRKLEDIKRLKDLDKDSVYIVGNKNEVLQLDLDISAIYLENVEQFKLNLFKTTEKAKYLLKFQHNQLFLIKLYDPNFYIKRTLTYNKVIEWNLFNQEFISKNDLYVFFGNEEKYKEKLKTLKETYKENFKFVKSQSQSQELMHLEKKHVHLFEISDQIAWVSTHGNSEALYKSMICEEKLLDEDDILQDQNLVIISAPKDFGKTCLIHHLNFKLRNSPSWILTISLDNNYNFNCLSLNIDIEDVAKFIANSCIFEDNSYVRCILSHCFIFGSQLKIYLMFDGFNKVFDEKSRQKFIKMINLLKPLSNVKVLITTTPHFCTELENGLGMLSVHLNSLNLELNVKLYLENSWKTEIDLFGIPFNVDNLATVAKNIYQHDFIGTPKNVVDIEKIMSPCLSIGKPSHSIENVFLLYQAYIEALWDNSFSHILSTPKQRNLIKKVMSTKLTEVALHDLLGFKIDSLDEELKELLNVGFIYRESSNYWAFSYPYVSAFLVSDCVQFWLSANLYLIDSSWNLEEFLIDELFDKDKYKLLRLFLNYRFQTLTMAPCRRKLCQEKLSNTIKREYMDYVYIQSNIHICIKENLYYLLQKFFFVICSPQTVCALLTLRNSASETPLWYAIKNYSSDTETSSLSLIVDYIGEHLKDNTDDVEKVLAATLVNCFVRNEDIVQFINVTKKYNQLHNLVITIQSKLNLIPKYFEACLQNSVDDIDTILKTLENDKIFLKYLLFTRNEYHQTGLHLTTSKEVAEKIISDENVRLGDYFNMTPLAQACRGGNLEIVELLINKPEARHQKDFLGNTLVMHAAKNGRIDCLKFLISKECEPIDSKNDDRLTALMLATQYGHSDCVNVLLQHKVDISLTDKNKRSDYPIKVQSTHKVKETESIVIGSKNLFS